MLLGFVPNSKRKMVESFCNNYRGAIRFWVINQSDRKVFRIRNNNICFFNLFHHTLFSHFTLFATNLSLYLWTSFNIFIFVFDFLLGHTHAFIKFESLKRYIDRGDQNQRRCYNKGCQPDHFTCRNKGWLNSHAR